MMRYRCHQVLHRASLLAALMQASTALAGGSQHCPQDEVLDDNGKCCDSSMLDVLDGLMLCFEEPNEMSVAVSFTLLGSFVFLISLQIFTNDPDRQMKQYAYKVISSTISIFCAVMMFQSINSLVEHWVIEPLQEREHYYVYAEFGVDLMHKLCWYTFTQIVLRWASGCFMEPSVRQDLMGPTRSKQEKAESMRCCEENCISYGTVLAHTTGFATINVWTSLQSLPPFNSSPLMALIPMGFSFIVQLILKKFTARCREHVTGKSGTKDAFEKKWDMQCEEAENDVLGLSLSVLCINALRYLINGFVPEGVGCLPNPEQKEEGTVCEKFLENGHRTWLQVFLLFGLGALFAVMLFCTKLTVEKCFPEEEKEVDEGVENLETEKDEKAEILDGVSETIVVTLGMSFSWCAFHSNKEILVLLSPSFLGEEENEGILALVLALEMTYLAFAMVRVLDKIADLPDKYTPPAVDKSIYAVVDATGLFIGFGWEQTFDVSVDALSAKTRTLTGSKNAPAISKLVLGFLISAFVFTAWKKFWCPFITKEGWRFNSVYSSSDLAPVIQQLDEAEPELQIKDKYQCILNPTLFNVAKFQCMPADTGADIRRKNRQIQERIEESYAVKKKFARDMAKITDMNKSVKAMKDQVRRIEAME